MHPVSCNRQTHSNPRNLMGKGYLLLMVIFPLKIDYLLYGSFMYSSYTTRARGISNMYHDP